MCLGSLPCSMTWFQPSFSCSTDGLTCFSCIQKSHGLVKLTDCKAIFSCGYLINPNDNPSTTVLDSWDEAFVLICCVGKREEVFSFYFWHFTAWPWVKFAGNIGMVDFKLFGNDVPRLMSNNDYLSSLHMFFLLGIVLTHRNGSGSKLPKRLLLARCSRLLLISYLRAFNWDQVIFHAWYVK